MQISVVPFKKIEKEKRIDAEYYQPHLLTYEKNIYNSGMPVVKLGEVIESGYRVVYENTDIVESPEDESRHVRFLQATNIQSNLPIVNKYGLGWVTNSDWQRYPLGRIKRGEILIEVKGQAEKVAIVPEDYPLNTLVSGSVYKFSVNRNDINKHYLLIYLLSKYGHGFRKRCLTNTLIGFVSKDYLYSILLPKPKEDFQKLIESLSNQIFDFYDNSIKFYSQAEQLLLDELGLSNWQAKHKLSFIKNYSDTQQAERIDAEYYQPKYDQITNAIKKYKGGWDKLENLVKIKDKNIKPKEKEIYKYIELANISNNGDITGFTEECGQELPTRARRRVSKGDVIVSSIEGSLSSIALVNDNLHNALCSTGFYVVNSKAINSETLLVLLKSLVGQLQLKKGCSGTILTAISKDEFSKVVLPKLAGGIQEKIRLSIQKMYEARYKSKQLLEIAKKGVEMAIEKTEAKAEAWIKAEVAKLER